MSIKQSYNQWSDQYDTNDNKTRDLDKIVTENTLSKYNFNHVLELGCGTGKNTGWFAEKAKEVVSVDFSEKMLSIAIEKVQRENVQFQQGDINQEWEVANNHFDLITSSLTLEHISNLDFIFTEANKKLKSSGLFFISELHPNKQYSGSKARYQSDDGNPVELTVFLHHLSDYLISGKLNNFRLLELDEWFDQNHRQEIPRLISFVFQKP